LKFFIKNKRIESNTEAARLFDKWKKIITSLQMKKATIPPVFIVIASALYFLLASAALAQEPVTDTKQDSKLVKYCTTSDNGKTSMMTADGKTVSEPIAFDNGATVSLDGIITWKDGSKTTLKNGDCVGVDNLGAVYVAKAPISSETKNSGVISNR
jgi:hypothetical protein